MVQFCKHVAKGRFGSEFHVNSTFRSRADDSIQNGHYSSTEQMTTVVQLKNKESLVGPSWQSFLLSFFLYVLTSMEDIRRGSVYKCKAGGGGGG